VHRIVVYGVVQGVGFRPTVYRVAKSLGLRGWVKNNGSNVEIVIDRDVESFLAELRKNLPVNARIERIDVSEYSGMSFDDFRILESSHGVKDFPPPPDLAMCDACLADFYEKGNRRYMYAFTNCTDCGARFTVIKNMPFDRINTTMFEFPMCRECNSEYEHPANRRFHAQTISCPECGPRYTLYDRNGTPVPVENPFEKFAVLIDAGKICVLKGYGGMHILCALDRIKYFRDWYRRKSKPFALMMRNLETVERYAYLSEIEREILLSRARPIVLLKKKAGFECLEDASPGLPNFGVMLPYAPVHHLIFQHLKSDGFVATSANVPGEPMIIENREAFALNADYYLLHNLKIHNRCDDSVLRVYSNRKFFIRKSRGFVPEALTIDAKGTVIAVGAQENLSASVLINGKIYTTQYLGDGLSYNVLQYMKGALSHYLRLFNVEHVDTICLDLHPGYTTRSVAFALAKKFNARTLEIQHHWAHAVSLFVDNSISNGVCIAIDGTGYGSDGKIWGGEVLNAGMKGFQRVGHLSEFPLIGGETAVNDIGRVAFAFAELTGNNLKREDDTLLRALMKKSVMCTSFGRVLDALSYVLGVCEERTYDGEPAMKLETLLMEGKPWVKMPDSLVECNGDEYVINVLPVFEKVFECRGSEKRADIAYAAVAAIVKNFVDVAIKSANEYGMKYIGVSGGVSYNDVIVSLFEKYVKQSGLTPLLHDRVPNGDMGISVGQCAIGAHDIECVQNS